MKLNTDTKIFLGIGIITVLIVIIASVLFTKQSGPVTLDKTVYDMKLLVKENSQKQMYKGAKLTLIEFSDFECPACKTVHPMVNALLTKYKGKVNFVFRHFPLPQHKQASIASQVAEAAGEQGKFWEMYNFLYERQLDWASQENATSSFVFYAKELKLNTTQFKKSLETKKFEQKIQDDLNDGKALGITSTPTFFLNGQKILKFEDIETIIKSTYKL